MREGEEQGHRGEEGEGRGRGGRGREERVRRSEWRGREEVGKEDGGGYNLHTYCKRNRGCGDCGYALQGEGRRRSGRGTALRNQPHSVISPSLSPCSHKRGRTAVPPCHIGTGCRMSHSSQ